MDFEALVNFLGDNLVTIIAILIVITPVVTSIMYFFFKWVSPIFAPDKEETLPPPPLLRTARAPFSASRSSLPKAH
jgi:hypothetical protein